MTKKFHTVSFLTVFWVTATACLAGSGVDPADALYDASVDAYISADSAWPDQNNLRRELKIFDDNLIVEPALADGTPPTITSVEYTVTGEHCSDAGECSLEYLFTYKAADDQTPEALLEYSYMFSSDVDWSPWSRETQVTYETTPYMPFTFIVRARDQAGNVSEEEEYEVSCW